jgi:hypothetical protein
MANPATPSAAPAPAAAADKPKRTRALRTKLEAQTLGLRFAGFVHDLEGTITLGGLRDLVASIPKNTPDAATVEFELDPNTNGTHVNVKTATGATVATMSAA